MRMKVRLIVVAWILAKAPPALGGSCLKKPTTLMPMLRFHEESKPNDIPSPKYLKDFRGIW
jgi:hypothetical protein